MNQNDTDIHKGIKLVFKMLLIIMIPMLVLGIFSILAIRAAANSSAEILIHHELSASNYSVDAILNQLDQGDFLYQSGMLYKGEIPVEQVQSQLSSMEQETDIGVLLFYGDQCILSSIPELSSAQAASIQIDSNLKNQVFSGQTVYITDYLIQKEPYYGCISPLYRSGTGSEIIGMKFTGLKTAFAYETYYYQIKKNDVFIVILLFITAFLSGLIVYRIVKQITKVVSGLDEVAEGTLTVELNSRLLKRADEIGSIARSVRALIRSFSSMLRSIIHTSSELDMLSSKFKTSFDSMTQSIVRINTAVDEIAGGATTQAIETQNVNGRVITIGETIHSAAGNAEALTSSSVRMLEYNKNVDMTLGELSKLSEETKSSVEKVQQQTYLTNHSAQEIKTATDVITDIANQTNLLSLNASIEAARAGELGRGFAVVAEEIRTLADQSRESAEMITAIIQTLIQNSEISVQTMDQTAEFIGKQNEKLAAARTTFDALNTEISKVGTAVTQITSELRELDSEKEQVFGSIENLAGIAQANAAGTQETAASMSELGQVVEECQAATKEMLEMAGSLATDTKKFKLDAESSTSKLLS